MTVERGDFACPPHLPPRDAWKVNPDTLRKFYAPTDDRGFVMLDETVETVKGLFEDDYEWPINGRHQQTKPDMHHFHWIARHYSSKVYSGRTIPHRFRELPTVKGIIPRQFHNVIHAVTLPPSQPEYREMARHVEAYQLAHRLFLSATRASEVQGAITSTLVESHDTIETEMLIKRFDRQFRDYRSSLERLVGSVGLEAFQLDDPKFARRKPREVARLLGRTVRFTETNYLPLFNAA